jgi:hypothetical protein
MPTADRVASSPCPSWSCAECRAAFEWMPIRSASDVLWLDFSEVVRGGAVGPPVSSTACQAGCSATWRQRTCAWSQVPERIGGAARPRRRRSLAKLVTALWDWDQVLLAILLFALGAAIKKSRRRASEHQSRASLSPQRNARRTATTRAWRLGALDGAGRESTGGADRFGPGSASGTSLSAGGLLDGRRDGRRDRYSHDTPLAADRPRRLHPALTPRSSERHQRTHRAGGPLPHTHRPPQTSPPFVATNSGSVTSTHLVRLTEPTKLHATALEPLDVKLGP